MIVSFILTGTYGRMHQMHAFICIHKVSKIIDSYCENRKDTNMRTV